MKKINNWLLGLWMSFCTALQFWPDALMQVWNMMPDDLKAAIPPLYVKAISFSILVMAMLGKMHGMKVHQAKLEQKVEDSNPTESQGANSELTAEGDKDESNN